jgi:hypothetical protein
MFSSPYPVGVMSGEQVGTTSRVTLENGPVGKIRYVLDFGPSGAKTNTTLRAIDGWLSNGAKFSGAIMMRPSKLPQATAESYVTAVEIEVKVYEIQDPNNEIAKFVLGRNNGPAVAAQVEDARLVLSESTREMVSSVVRSALSYALGENGRDVVLSKLQLDYGFGFAEVTDFPGRFMELLNEILDGGSKYIEDRIVLELVDHNPDLKGCSSFKDAVTKLVAIDTLQQR